MPADQLEPATSASSTLAEPARRRWEAPAVTRLEVVEVTEGKPGFVADGDDFEFS